METMGVVDDSDLMELDTLASKSVFRSVLSPEDTVLRYVSLQRSCQPGSGRGRPSPWWSPR